MLNHPSDREFGIETAGFGERGFRLVHLADLGVGGGQSFVDPPNRRKPESIAWRALVDGRVGMAKVQF